MKREFAIYGTTVSSDVNPNREWDWIRTVNTLSQAKQTAKRISKMKMWYEVEIRGMEDAELIHHSYWQNGRLEIDMCV